MSRVKPGSVGGTYSGNAVALAAANAVLDVLTDPKEAVLANVNARGEQFRAGVKALQKNNPHFRIGEVRGKGLWNAIEFLDHPSTVGAAGKLVKAGYDCQLLLMNAGIYGQQTRLARARWFCWLPGWLVHIESVLLTVCPSPCCPCCYHLQNPQRRFVSSLR